MYLIALSDEKLKLTVWNALLDKRDSSQVYTFQVIDGFHPRERRRRPFLAIKMVRLRTAKEYCGQHAGPCEINPHIPQRPKKKLKLLEFQDWVEFHRDVVNAVLEELDPAAEAWTTPHDTPPDRGKKLWVRRFGKARRRWDWWTAKHIAGRPLRVTDHGSPSQFEAE